MLLKINGVRLSVQDQERDRNSVELTGTIGFLNYFLVDLDKKLKFIPNGTASLTEIFTSASSSQFQRSPR